MKKINLFLFLITMLLLLLFFRVDILFKPKVALAQVDVPLADSYSIELNGSALNTINGIVISLSFSGGSAELQRGVILQASGASQLLTDVNATANTIAVTWTGQIKDGKAKITGKLKPGSVTGNPTITITKIQAQGGADITSSVTAVAKIFNSSQPIATPTPFPSPTPEATPTPLPTPTPSPAPDTPHIKLFGEGIIHLTSPNQKATELAKVVALNFTKPSTCSVSSSDDSLLMSGPRFFRLDNVNNERTLRGRVPSLKAQELLDQGHFLKTAQIAVSCKNDAEATKEIIITSKRICKRGEDPQKSNCSCAPGAQSKEENLECFGLGGPSVCDAGRLAQVTESLCTCQEGLVYTTNGCKPPVICSPNEPVTDDNPCQCASGAKLDENVPPKCECPNPEEAYTINGCTKDAKESKLELKEVKLFINGVHITYSKDFEGCFRLKNTKGEVLLLDRPGISTTICDVGDNVKETYTPLSIKPSLKVGEQVQLCSKSDTICSNVITVTQEGKVELKEVKLFVNGVHITYSKDFEGCFRLKNTKGEVLLLDRPGISTTICDVGDNVKETYTPLSIKPSLKVGEQVQLCSKSDTICSNVITVTQEGNVELKEVKLFNGISITYSKDFEGCLRLKNTKGETLLTDRPGLNTTICDVSDNAKDFFPPSTVKSSLKVGEQVQLCSKSDTICSNVVTVIGKVEEKVDKVELKEVKFSSKGGIDITYFKDSKDCVRLKNPKGELLVQDLPEAYLCENGTHAVFIPSPVLIQSIKSLPEKVKLCNDNNTLCSNVISVIFR